MRTARDLTAIARTIQRRGLPDDIEARRVLDDVCRLTLDGRQSVGLRLAAAEVVAAAMQFMLSRQESTTREWHGPQTAQNRV
jgi:hypothetical protein